MFVRALSPYTIGYMLRSSYSDACHQQTMWVTNNIGYDAQQPPLQRPRIGRKDRISTLSVERNGVRASRQTHMIARGGQSRGIPQTLPVSGPGAEVDGVGGEKSRNQPETLTLRRRYLVDLGADSPAARLQDPARVLPYSVRRFLRCIVSLSCFESINAPPRRKRT